MGHQDLQLRQRFSKDMINDTHIVVMDHTGASGRGTLTASPQGSATCILKKNRHFAEGWRFTTYSRHMYMGDNIVSTPDNLRKVSRNQTFLNTSSTHRCQSPVPNLRDVFKFQHFMSYPRICNVRCNSNTSYNAVTAPCQCGGDFDWKLRHFSKVRINAAHSSYSKTRPLYDEVYLLFYFYQSFRCHCYAARIRRPTAR